MRRRSRAPPEITGRAVQGVAIERIGHRIEERHLALHAGSARGVVHDEERVLGAPQVTGSGSDPPQQHGRGKFLIAKRECRLVQGLERTECEAQRNDQRHRDGQQADGQPGADAHY